MYHVGQRVDDKIFGKGTIVCVDSRDLYTQLLIKFDESKSFMHRGMSFDGKAFSDKDDCYWVDTNREGLRVLNNRKIELFNRYEGA